MDLFVPINLINKQRCADLFSSRTEWTEYDVYILARNDYLLFRSDKDIFYDLRLELSWQKLFITRC